MADYYITTNIRKEIGRRIKKVREDQQQTQVEVAVRVGINSSYYSKIERGEVNPSLGVFYKVVKVLNVKSSDILPF
jgi:transcriptional regulator with XRE-family HTH domain